VARAGKLPGPNGSEVKTFWRFFFGGWFVWRRGKVRGGGRPRQFFALRLLGSFVSGDSLVPEGGGKVGLRGARRGRAPRKRELKVFQVFVSLESWGFLVLGGYSAPVDEGGLRRLVKGGRVFFLGGSGVCMTVVVSEGLWAPVRTPWPLGRPGQGSTAPPPIPRSSKGSDRVDGLFFLTSKGQGGGACFGFARAAGSGWSFGGRAIRLGPLPSA